MDSIIDMKKIRKLLVFALCISFVIMVSGCTAFIDKNGFEWAESIRVNEMNVNQKSYTEIAEILQTFGIKGITDTLAAELEESYAQLPEEIEFDKVATFLIEVGSGSINFDTWEWTPSENGVYCFDVEVFDEGTMYTNFLLGIVAIGDGELDFKNIIEDTSGVNWERGTGKRTVSFEWNGHTYTLEAKAQGDWFDTKVTDELNKIIIANGNENRLYFASDGYQECIVFYRNAEWAEAFQSETGLRLSK